MSKKNKVKYVGYVWTYYPQHQQGYLKISDNKVFRTVQLIESKLILDLDKDNNVVGIEYLN